MADVHVIYGPPGTGKTTKLISLLEEELTAGVPPNRIAYVSFTQEGAYQGKRRALERFPQYTDRDFVHFRTLHSMAFGSLRLNYRTVVHKKDYQLFAKKMGMNFAGFYSDAMHGAHDKYLFYDQLVRNNSKAAERFDDDLDQETLNLVRSNYRRFKQARGIYDFTDMLQQFVDNETVIDVDVAFVDEAQDLTSLQWRMVWVAFSKAKRIYIAGDDDQAIYEWSGADVDQFLGLHATTRTVLSQSYRLPDEILKFSRRLTSSISRRIEKEYKGTGPGGMVVHLADYKEINIRPDETYMFLSRNRVYLEDIVEWLSSKGVIFNFLGATSFLMSEYDKIVMYERERKNPQRKLPPEVYELLSLDLLTDYNINDPWYDAFNWDITKKAYYRDIARSKPDLHKMNVRVSTIHSVKGAEADNVILLPDITRKVYINLNRYPDTEHRAFYVACTRAKRRLLIVDAHSKYEYPLLGI